jgi:hypothetical protein
MTAGEEIVNKSVDSSDRQRFHARRGAVAVLVALLLIVILCFGALAVDIGYLTRVQSQLRNAVDAATLAGAGAMSFGDDAAIVTVRDSFGKNLVAGRNLTEQEFLVELGDWDPEKQEFIPVAVDLPSAIRVSGTRDDVSVFFARTIGMETQTLQASAVATYLPRDIMLVLDYSASMNYDTQFRHLPHLGRDVVEQGIRNMYEDLGSPRYGNMTFEPRFIETTDAVLLLEELGLTDVPYPYPVGSWQEYFMYVQRVRFVRNVGYQQHYGYLTLLDYWQSVRPTHWETPDLWMTRHQPMTAMKNAVTLFLEYVARADVHDRVGLTVYNASDGTALVEHGLTRDFAAVEAISRQRQAAHYERNTNVGDGIRVAAEELARTARPGAFKLLVVMTDGHANRPVGVNAREYALQQAQIVAGQGIRFLTISFSVMADELLMGEIAEIGGGLHFNVPGQGTVEEYEAELIEAFVEAARFRPLRLVK